MEKILTYYYHRNDGYVNGDLRIQLTRLSVGISGIVVIALSVIGLIGRLVGYDKLVFRAVESDPGMAVITAVAFILVGAALFLISWTDHLWSH